MSEENSGEVNIVDKITYSLESELGVLQAPSNECSIYRVPHQMREVDDRLYSPKVISIGPLHHGKKELREMEKHKRLYLHHFRQLSSSRSLKEFVEFIRGRETQLRNRYEETIQFGSEELVKMVLVDAAFIILLFLHRAFGLHEILGDDRIFRQPRMFDEISDDLRLLENQLPFFILEDLYEFSKLPELLQKSFTFPETSEFRHRIEFIKLTHLFFDNWGSIPKRISSYNYSGGKVEHFNHYIRLRYAPPGKHLERKRTESMIIPSAVELDQAGVKFKPGSGIDIFDITFKKGVLEIPPLEITESLELLFHNLRAFELCHCCTWQSLYNTTHIEGTNEQCHCWHELFSGYIDIMFGLVKGSKDAQLLVQNKIILNWQFGDEQLSSFFYKLEKGTKASNLTRYADLIKALNEHSSATRNKWKATLKKGYFKTPWTTISTFAAALLLLLTVVQTICSILQTKHK